MTMNNEIFWAAFEDEISKIAGLEQSLRGFSEKMGRFGERAATAPRRLVNAVSGGLKQGWQGAVAARAAQQKPVGKASAGSSSPQRKPLVAQVVQKKPSAPPFAAKAATSKQPPAWAERMRSLTAGSAASPSKEKPAAESFEQKARRLDHEGDARASDNRARMRMRMGMSVPTKKE
jgi:hypothetical protein